VFAAEEAYAVHCSDFSIKFEYDKFWLFFVRKAEKVLTEPP
jgi:hypothetical protein